MTDNRILPLALMALTAWPLFLSTICSAVDSPAAELPEPGTVVIDQAKGEVILSAKVQFPEDKPCINEYGQRIQAFVGCATAAGGDAKMAGYFVFLVDVPTEKVFDGLKKAANEVD